MRFIVIGLVTSVFGFFSPWHACANGSPENNADAPLPNKEQIEQLLQAYDVPGMAMASLSGCQIDSVVVAGKADLQTGASVVPLTAFEAASLSKPVFAYLVLTLVDQGTIDLDRPMADHFDAKRLPDKAKYATITPRMILAHRSGLPNWVDEKTDFYQRTAAIPFEAEPDTTYTYSGEAFQILQAFVEQQTGKSLQQLFKQHLGVVMPNSTFVRPLPDRALPSRGYARASDPTSGRDMTNLSERGMAASSLATTVEDYANFLSLVCRRRGLKPTTYNDMLSPQTPIPTDLSPLPTTVGLGWMLADIGPDTLVLHTGNNDEYRAIAGFQYNSGDGVVVLTNGSNGEALIDALLPTPAD